MSSLENWRLTGFFVIKEVKENLTNLAMKAGALNLSDFVRLVLVSRKTTPISHIFKELSKVTAKIKELEFEEKKKKNWKRANFIWVKLPTSTVKELNKNLRLGTGLSFAKVCKLIVYYYCLLMASDNRGDWPQLSTWLPLPPPPKPPQPQPLSQPLPMPTESVSVVSKPPELIPEQVKTGPTKPKQPAIETGTIQIEKKKRGRPRKEEITEQSKVETKPQPPIEQPRIKVEEPKKQIVIDTIATDQPQIEKLPPKTKVEQPAIETEQPAIEKKEDEEQKYRNEYQLVHTGELDWEFSNKQKKGGQISEKPRIHIDEKFKYWINVSKRIFEIRKTKDEHKKMENFISELLNLLLIVEDDNLRNSLINPPVFNVKRIFLDIKKTIKESMIKRLPTEQLNKQLKEGMTIKQALAKVVSFANNTIKETQFIYFQGPCSLSSFQHKEDREHWAKVIRDIDLTKKGMEMAIGIETKDSKIDEVLPGDWVIFQCKYLAPDSQLNSYAIYRAISCPISGNKIPFSEQQSDISCILKLQKTDDNLRQALEKVKFEMLNPTPFHLEIRKYAMSPQFWKETQSLIRSIGYSEKNVIKKMDLLVDSFVFEKLLFFLDGRNEILEKDQTQYKENEVSFWPQDVLNAILDCFGRLAYNFDWELGFNMTIRGNQYLAIPKKVTVKEATDKIVKFMYDKYPNARPPEKKEIREEVGFESLCLKKRNNLVEKVYHDGYVITEIDTSKTDINAFPDKQKIEMNQYGRNIVNIGSFVVYYCQVEKLYYAYHVIGDNMADWSMEEIKEENLPTVLPIWKEKLNYFKSQSKTKQPQPPIETEQPAIEKPKIKVEEPKKEIVIDTIATDQPQVEQPPPKIETEQPAIEKPKIKPKKEYVEFSSGCINTSSHHKQKYKHWGKNVRNIELAEKGGNAFIQKDWLDSDKVNLVAIGDFVVFYCGDSDTFDAYHVSGKEESDWEMTNVPRKELAKLLLAMKKKIEEFKTPKSVQPEVKKPQPLPMPTESVSVVPKQPELIPEQVKTEPTKQEPKIETPKVELPTKTTMVKVNYPKLPMLDILSVPDVRGTLEKEIQSIIKKWHIIGGRPKQDEFPVGTYFLTHGKNTLQVLQLDEKGDLNSYKSLEINKKSKFSFLWFVVSCADLFPIESWPIFKEIELAKKQNSSESLSNAVRMLRKATIDLYNNQKLSEYLFQLHIFDDVFGDKDYYDTERITFFEKESKGKGVNNILAGRIFHLYENLKFVEDKDNPRPEPQEVRDYRKNDIEQIKKDLEIEIENYNIRLQKARQYLETLCIKIAKKIAMDFVEWNDIHDKKEQEKNTYYSLLTEIYEKLSQNGIYIQRNLDALVPTEKQSLADYSTWYDTKWNRLFDELSETDSPFNQPDRLKIIGKFSRPNLLLPLLYLFENRNNKFIFKYLNPLRNKYLIKDDSQKTYYKSDNRLIPFVIEKIVKEIKLEELEQFKEDKDENYEILMRKLDDTIKGRDMTVRQAIEKIVQFAQSAIDGTLWSTPQPEEQPKVELPIEIEQPKPTIQPKKEQLQPIKDTRTESQRMEDFFDSLLAIVDNDQSESQKIQLINKLNAEYQDDNFLQQIVENKSFVVDYVMSNHKELKPIFVFFSTVTDSKFRRLQESTILSKIEKIEKELKANRSEYEKMEDFFDSLLAIIDKNQLEDQKIQLINKLNAEYKDDNYLDKLLENKLSIKDYHQLGRLKSNKILDLIRKVLKKKLTNQEPKIEEVWIDWNIKQWYKFLDSLLKGMFGESSRHSIVAREFADLKNLSPLFYLTQHFGDEKFKPFQDDFVSYAKKHSINKILHRINDFAIENTDWTQDLLDETTKKLDSPFNDKLTIRQAIQSVIHWAQRLILSGALNPYTYLELHQKKEEARKKREDFTTWDYAHWNKFFEKMIDKEASPFKRSNVLNIINNFSQYIAPILYLFDQKDNKSLSKFFANLSKAYNPKEIDNQSLFDEVDPLKRQCPYIVILVKKINEHIKLEQIEKYKDSKYPQEQNDYTLLIRRLNEKFNDQLTVRQAIEKIVQFTENVIEGRFFDEK